MNIKFIENFSNNILPIYKAHENKFDIHGIHGRLHISRSIIFAEIISNYYKSINKKIDIDSIRYAISFHDSGRKGNGTDLWQKDSERICFSYLQNIGYDYDYCKYVSDLINKDKNSDINKDIVYDVDVLEIMRPVCGNGGRLGFNDKFLRFSEPIKDDLVKDAWKLIKYTEDNKYIFNDNYLSKIINIIRKNDYKVLNDFL